MTKLSEIIDTEQTTGESPKRVSLSSIKEEEGSFGKDLLGSVGGGAALLGAGYGMYKSGIPQNIGRGVGSISKGIANLPKVVNINKGEAFATQMRKAFVDTHTEMVTKFGGAIDTLAAKNPNTFVNLSELVSDLQTNPDISKQALSILKKVPKLDMILENPKLASSVPLRDAQEILNYIQTKIPKNIRANNFDLIDTANTIRGQQLEAFPELAGPRAEYKAFIEPYKNIKQYFRFNKILDAIKNKFGGAEGQVAAEKILPKEVIGKMKGYRAAAKLAEIPGDIPLVGKLFKSVGGALGIAPMITQALTFSQKIEEAKKKGHFTISPFGEIIPLSKEDLMI